MSEDVRYDEDFDGYGGDINDPKQRCKHGTFIGVPGIGPDYMCGWCESGEEPPPPPPQCEFLWEAWGPHPGCREFMDEPEAVIQCSNEAVMVIVGREHGPEGVEERNVHACMEHFVQMAEPSMYWELVRLERVG